MEPGVRIATPPQSLASGFGDKSTAATSLLKPVPHAGEFSSEVRCLVWFGL